MEFTIWKYEIPFGDDAVVPMKEGAELLCVAEQERPSGESVICGWALVWPGASDVNRHFRIAGTGHPLKNKDNLHYIGSVHNFCGTECVFHVFERKEH